MQFTCITNSHKQDMEKCKAKLGRDYNLLKQGKDLVKQLKPVGDDLNHLQGDKISTADACDMRLDLLSDANPQSHEQAVNERFSEAILPMHYFAHMMHLQY